MNDRLPARARDAAGNVQVSMVQELSVGIVAEVDGIYRVSAVARTACVACVAMPS